MTRAVPRRRFLARASALATAAALPRFAGAQGARSIVDDAGRRADVPARAARLYAAGPPASMLALDGVFDRMAASVRTIGALTGKRERAEALARYASGPTRDGPT